MIAAIFGFWLGIARAGWESDERQQAAETSFDTIMMQNAVNPAKSAPAGAPLDGLPPESLPVAPAPPLNPTGMIQLPEDERVEVPLLRYELTRAQIAAAEREAERHYETLVVLGESTYSGRAVDGGLELHLQVRATLMGPGYWKAVPLVGEEVAVVRARAGNTPIALTNQNGYQVWVTDAVGELTLDLDLLVPARGPRGSMEYDFLVPRTPVTRFECSFSDPGLEPKLDRTVRSNITASASSTRLDAWLEPTSRIHLVGFKVVGVEEERAAKVYVETLSLLSIEESSAEVFSVLRYNILQSGTRKFDIRIPQGFSVVSADGDGAFRYTTETGPEGTLLRGETAYPIRDQYEVSLRLSHTLQNGALEVHPPSAVGVEREQGWIGMEVMGTVQVEEKSRENALAVDISQLPSELVGNAVSPVLSGWRYHEDGARIALSAVRLPEREPAAGSIDRVQATTTIASEGRSRTELNVTLRNRLRHSLSLRLPEGAQIRACSLDGQSISPSQADDGTLLLPLKRSPGERPKPFTLQIALEHELPPLGAFGAPELVLPAFGLPVSSLSWDVDVPAANRYTRLYGDIDAQETPDAASSPQPYQTRLRYARYWIGADKAVAVRFGYLRGWLRLPLALALAGVWLALVGRLRHGWDTARFPRISAFALVIGLGLLGRYGSGVAAALALPAAAIQAGLHTRTLAHVRAAAASLAAPAEGDPAPGSWRAVGPAGKLMLLGGTAIVAMVLFGLTMRALYVLSNPL